MQPAVVTRENARIARENISRRWKNKILIKKRARKIKYRVRDLVRISRAKASRKVTGLSGARKYFKFIVFLISKTFMNCEI